MGILSLQKGIKLIDGHPKSFFKGSNSEILINKAEFFLQLKFPSSYKLFLLELGCGSFMDKEFYGIIDENFEKGVVPNGIWLTWHERQYSELDKNLIIVGDSDDGYFVLNTKKMYDNECPVCIWLPNSTKSFENLEIISPSFGNFFLTELLSRV